MSWATRVANCVIAAKGYPERYWDDLRSEAYVGLVKAADAFDAGHASGASFKTYSFKIIRGHVLEFMRVLCGKRGERIPFNVTVQSLDNDDPKAEQAIQTALAQERLEHGMELDFWWRLMENCCVEELDREMIIRHYIGEELQVDLARELPFTPSRLSQRLQAARLKARDYIENGGNGGSA